MYNVFYTVAATALAKELEWLKNIRVFPAQKNSFDWEKNIPTIMLGMIVDEETYMVLKISRKLDSVSKYKKK